MGTVEIICFECGNKSTYDALFASEKGVIKICPKCGKEIDNSTIKQFA